MCYLLEIWSLNFKFSNTTLLLFLEWIQANFTSSLKVSISNIRQYLVNVNWIRIWLNSNSLCYLLEIRSLNFKFSNTTLLLFLEWIKANFTSSLKVPISNIRQYLVHLNWILIWLFCVSCLKLGTSDSYDTHFQLQLFSSWN